MSEETKVMTNEAEETKEAPATDKPKAMKKAPALKLSDISKGVLTLSVPIRARSKDITELNYDFSKLTGWEYAEAMDSDGAARNVFVTTRKQAISLFAAAVAKATEDVDAVDVKTQLSLQDAQSASVIATLFLNKAAQEAGKNTYGV